LSGILKSPLVSFDPIGSDTSRIKSIAALTDFENEGTGTPERNKIYLTLSQIVNRNGTDLKLTTSNNLTSKSYRKDNQRENLQQFFEGI
jgi:hypothetical protein